MAFESLEDVSKSLFERCIRSYRGIIINSDAGYCGTSSTKPVIHASCSLFQSLSNVCYVNNNYIFKYLYSGLFSETQLQQMWQLLQNIQVVDLPTCIKKAQLKTLQRLYYADDMRIHAKRLVHVCVFCAYKQSTNVVKRKAKNGKISKLYCKCRLDSNTQQLLCVHCNIPSIIAVNILGRLLHIGNTAYVLGVCCGEIIEYTGSGYEFTNVCGPQCTSFSSPSATPSIARSCQMCKQKNNLHHLAVLDIPERKMAQHYFCYRHFIPNHLSRSIMDKRELELVLSNMQASGSLAQHHPRRQNMSTR